MPFQRETRCSHPFQTPVPAHRFHMEHMEQAIGGQLPGFAFKLEPYEQRMRQFDTEADAELSAAAQHHKVRGAKQGRPACRVLRARPDLSPTAATRAGCSERRRKRARLRGSAWQEA